MIAQNQNNHATRAPAERSAAYRRDNLVLIAATLVCLVPFLGKAFNIDDPMFLWVAKHIVGHPLDPFGFNVNWGGGPNPMFLQTKNPPLFCYYLALASRLVGWGEVGLHTLMLVPAIAAVLGVHQLARRFCGNPLQAALICLLTPAFLVSSTSVMCDVPMLALWIWAVVLWVRGLDDHRWPLLLVSSALVAAAAMSKYYGMALIPLLAGYSAWRLKRVGAWVACLALPVAVLGLYEAWSAAVYGQGLLSVAMDFASSARQDYGIPDVQKYIGGLAFPGGCLIAVLFLAPILWSRRSLLIAAAVAVATALCLASSRSVGNFALVCDGRLLWSAIAQISVFVTVGLGLISLAIRDLWDHRDADSAMLVAWFLGTLVFACAINWTVNARSILPAAPVLGILVARRLGKPGKRAWSGSPRTAFVLLIPAAVLAVWVGWADCALANAQRDAATRIHARYARPGRTIHIPSHWGFQYYLTQYADVSEIDCDRFICKRGDIVAMSVNNVNRPCIPRSAVTRLGSVCIPLRSGLSILRLEKGAGFYSDLYGPLPFVFGPTLDERFEIFESQVSFGVIDGQVYLHDDIPSR